MTTRARIQAGDGDTRHGTTNGYSNLRCRCEACRAAWTRYVLARRETRKTLLPYRFDRLAHGSVWTYTNHGCRCRPCIAAKAQYTRKLQAAAS